MFKRLYAIGAHEDFFPHAPYQIFAAVWYGEYQGVVQAVPHRGIKSTTPWYWEYHAVVLRVPHRGIPTNRKYKKQYRIATYR